MAAVYLPAVSRAAQLTDQLTKVSRPKRTRAIRAGRLCASAVLRSEQGQWKHTCIAACRSAIVRAAALRVVSYDALAHALERTASRPFQAADAQQPGSQSAHRTSRGAAQRSTTGAAAQRTATGADW